MPVPTNRPTEQLEGRLFLSTAAPHAVAASDKAAAAVHAAAAPTTPAPAARSGNVNGGPDGQNVSGGPAEASQAPPAQSSDNAETASTADQGEIAPSLPAPTTGESSNQSEGSDAAQTSSSGQVNIGEAPTQTSDNSESASATESASAAKSASTTFYAAGGLQGVAPQARVVAFDGHGDGAPVELARTAFNSRRPIEAEAVESHLTQVMATIPQASFTVIADAVTTMAQPLRGAPPLAEATIRALLKLSRPDALATFADAIAGFAHESAAVGTLLAVTETHRFPWVVTTGVLGVDAVLVGHWYAARRERQRRIAAERDRLPFSVRCI
ncbi:MAG: hypothetical protein JWN40_5097 [Phycisphaerales bacterium]|nr:hypothetical protein [Phycisphaerales bacterium]